MYSRVIFICTLEKGKRKKKFMPSSTQILLRAPDCGVTNTQSTNKPHPTRSSNNNNKCCTHFECYSNCLAMWTRRAFYDVPFDLVESILIRSSVLFAICRIETCASSFTFLLFTFLSLLSINLKSKWAFKPLQATWLENCWNAKLSAMIFFFFLHHFCSICPTRWLMADGYWCIYSRFLYLIQILSRAYFGTFFCRTSIFHSLTCTHALPFFHIYNVSLSLGPWFGHRSICELIPNCFEYFLQWMWKLIGFIIDFTVHRRN